LTETTKGAITKAFLSKIEDSLNFRINITPKFKAIVTGHGNIKVYLHKHRKIGDPTCPCRQGPKTVQNIVFDCFS